MQYSFKKGDLESLLIHSQLFEAMIIVLIMLILDLLSGRDLFPLVRDKRLLLFLVNTFEIQDDILFQMCFHYAVENISNSQ